MELKDIIINFVLTIYGGFVGAVFSLFATGDHNGMQLWFLIFMYGVYTFIILILLNIFMKDKKQSK